MTAVRTPLAPERVRNRLRGAHAYRPVLLGQGMACRVCVATFGFHSAVLDSWFATRGEHDAHFTREHPEWAQR